MFNFITPHTTIIFLTRPSVRLSVCQSYVFFFNFYFGSKTQWISWNFVVMKDIRRALSQKLLIQLFGGVMLLEIRPKLNILLKQFVSATPQNLWNFYCWRSYCVRVHIYRNFPIWLFSWNIDQSKWATIYIYFMQVV